MAFTPYQNITSAVAVELIASGEDVSSISSILIANTHASSDAYVDLYLDLHSRTYYFMKGYMLKKGETLILNERNGWSKHLSFNNGKDQYALILKLSSTGTTTPSADVMIKR